MRPPTIAEREGASPVNTSTQIGLSTVSVIEMSIASIASTCFMPWAKSADATPNCTIPMNSMAATLGARSTGVYINRNGIETSAAKACAANI